MALTYHGRRFRPAAAEAAGTGGTGGVPDADGSGTVARWSQDGDLVWADIAGPGVRVGRLVGSVRADGVIDAAYCFVTPAGTAAGTCVSTPEELPDGRLRLTERWRRVDGSSGVSYAEEIR